MQTLVVNAWVGSLTRTPPKAVRSQGVANRRGKFRRHRADERTRIEMEPAIA